MSNIEIGYKEEWKMCQRCMNVIGPVGSHPSTWCNCDAPLLPPTKSLAKEAVAEKIKYLAAQRADWDKVLNFVTENADAFDVIGITPNIFLTDQVDLNQPTREQVLVAIKTFPGTWTKGKVQAYMHYTLNHPSGIKIRLWATELPPTCKVVKKTVVIPAIPAQPERIEETEEILCEVAL